MGSMTRVRPAASRPAREPRPVLVSVLAGAWILMSSSAGVSAILALSRSSSTAELRIFAALFLVLAALGGTGAVGLLRKRTWARALLATVGVVALALSALNTYRLVTAASAPAVDLAATEPDAANALVLFRAGSAVALLLSSIPLLLVLGFLRHPAVRSWLGVPARPRTGPDPLLLVAAAAVLVAAGAALLSKKRTPIAPAPVLRGVPAETFLWSDQPVAFPPPPAPFTRERHAEGGRKGVSFTRYEVPPTRITVAEAFLDPSPNTPEEAIARLRLTPETFRSTESAQVGDPEPAAVAGAPAYRTDYTLRERSMNHRGREIVVLAGRHVFVFTFLGRDSDLPLFDRLVQSTRFPAPGGKEGAVLTAREDGPPGTETDAGGGTEIHVGEHRVTLRVPDGWERVDYGAKQEFRSGEARIALVDGGELPPGTGATNLEDEWLVQRALTLFGHDRRRWEVASRTRVTVGDREALVVDTREPLSHVFHQRTVVFVNGGRLLAAGMVMGVPEANRGPLDELARSVRFRS